GSLGASVWRLAVAMNRRTRASVSVRRATARALVLRLVLALTMASASARSVRALATELVSSRLRAARSSRSRASEKYPAQLWAWAARQLTAQAYRQPSPRSSFQLPAQLRFQLLAWALRSRPAAWTRPRLRCRLARARGR